MISPNAISLPIMVMQTLCEQPIVNADFNDDSSVCFAEASSLLFVYSIGWHLMFWSYGFPKLKSLVKPIDDEIKLAEYSIDEKNKNKYHWENLWSKDNKLWLQTVFLSPSMIAIYLSLFIGLIAPIQNSLFFDKASIFHPIGLALITLGDPVVCVNSLGMYK